MDGHCEKHVFEATEGLCRTCGGEFCGDCLVFAYGPRKPPYCVSCALSAAGVRSTAARPPVRSRRDVRRELKEQRRRAKVATRSSIDGTADLFEATTIPATRPPVELAVADGGPIERGEALDHLPPPPAHVPSIFDQTLQERVG